MKYFYNLFLLVLIITACTPSNQGNGLVDFDSDAYNTPESYDEEKMDSQNDLRFEGNNNSGRLIYSKKKTGNEWLISTEVYRMGKCHNSYEGLLDIKNDKYVLNVNSRDHESNSYEICYMKFTFEFLSDSPDIKLFFSVE